MSRGVSVQEEDLCPEGVSVWGSLSGSLCVGESLSRGLIQGGLYPGGVSVKGVSVQGVSLWGSLSRGVSVWDSLSRRSLCPGRGGIM